MQKIFDCKSTKSSLRRFVYGLLMVSLCLGVGRAHAQQQTTLKGSVRDAAGNQVPGATVTVKGTYYGGTTDGGGNFNFIATVDDKSVLVVSFLGYRSQEVGIGERRTFDIRLEEDATSIDAVVVTGFQNISKTTFTGASTKVMAEDIKVKGVTDVSRMLEGQVAGVTIQNVSGTFGSAPKVRIRGASSINGANKPLWVIDGVVHEDIVNISNDDLTSGDPTTLLGSAVAGLNSNDIESIDVLKDASAIALYGARAMNGVIVVTTKRGSADVKPTIRYSSNYTVMLKPSYLNYDIMSSDEQMSVYNELDKKGWLSESLFNRSNWGVYGKMYKLIHTYDESTGSFGLRNTAEAKEAFLRRYTTANTDWFDVLFRNSLLQEHSLSISAGVGKSSFYGSLSMMNDQGWSIADRVNRYTANLRQDVTLGRFKMGYQVVGSVRQQRAPGTISRRTNVVEGSYDRDFDINPFSYALNTSRAMTAYDANGDREYYQRNYAPFNILTEMENNRILLGVVDFKMQGEASYEIIKGLKWEFVGAYRYVKSDREHEITEDANMANAYRAADNDVMRRNNRYLYSDPDHPELPKVVVLPSGGFYNRAEDLMSSYDFRNSITWSASFNKHNINAMAGQQVSSANRQKYSNTGYGYLYNQGGNVSTDYRILKQMIEGNFAYFSNGYEKTRTAAFYAKADYDYEGRYVFSANVRYEGSNGLGKSRKARWLPTWGVSAKWNLDNEPFARDWRWLTYASVRSSYGLVATMPPAANSSAIYYDKVTNRPLVEDRENIVTLDSPENRELTWEKSYMANIGLDIAVFNRRLDLVVDVWQRKSFDLISGFKNSGVGGFPSKEANYANMDSWGWEITLGGVPVRAKDFSWRVNITAGYAYNLITNTQATPRIFDMVNPNGGKLQGYPVNSLFSVVYTGLNQYGVPLFISDTGKESMNVYLQSRTLDYIKYEGTIDPPYTGSLSNTFTWKNLSLNVYITFQAGNKIRLAPSFMASYSDLNAMSRKFYDRWILPGTSTSVPSILNGYENQAKDTAYPYNNYNYSDQMVARGDFIRLKTLSLSYNIPADWIGKSKFIHGASVSVAGSNLFMLYQDRKLNGQDPEFFNSGGVAQPLQKQIVVALSLTF